LYFVVRVRCRRNESSRSLSHILMRFFLVLCVLLTAFCQLEIKRMVSELCFTQAIFTSVLSFICIFPSFVAKHKTDRQTDRQTKCTIYCSLVENRPHKTERTVRTRNLSSSCFKRR